MSRHSALYGGLELRQGSFSRFNFPKNFPVPYQSRGYSHNIKIRTSNNEPLMNGTGRKALQSRIDSMRSWLYSFMVGKAAIELHIYILPHHTSATSLLISIGLSPTCFPFNGNGFGWVQSTKLTCFWLTNLFEYTHTIKNL